MSQKFVTVQAEDLRRYMIDLMEASGASRKSAEAAASVHLDADLKGMGVQGFDYLPYTLKSLERGLIDGKAEPVIARRLAGSAFIDGQGGMGHPAAILAADLAVEIAREAGSATVVIGNSTDIFMIGFYAERIARAGVIGIVATSGPPLVHPHGGVERMLSTNPIAFGFPRPEAPFVFDMATTTIASSRVRQAAYEGAQVPEGSGIGPDGLPTTDARAIRQGALSPLGGYKGFGLGLVVALLCGPLSGSGVGLELAGWQAEGETKTQGHIVIAIDPAAFGDAKTYLESSERYIQAIKASQKASGVDEIRIPGEHSAAIRARQQKEGIAVLVQTCRNVEPYAKKFRVPIPLALRV